MRGLIKDMRMAMHFFQNIRRIRRERESARAEVYQISAYRGKEMRGGL